MENYPYNSKNNKRVQDATPKKIDKVVDRNRVSRRKKPFSKHIKEMIFQEDGRSILSRIIIDVIVPSAQDAIIESVESAVRGDGYRPSSRTPARSSGRVSYSSISRGPAPDDRREVSRRARETHNFDEFILETRAEANEILDKMFSILGKYEQVSVLDFYTMLDTTAEFTDEKWGWTDLRGSEVVKVRGGWLIDLPRPIELKLN